MTKTSDEDFKDRIITFKSFTKDFSTAPQKSQVTMIESANGFFAARYYKSINDITSPELRKAAQEFYTEAMKIDVSWWNADYASELLSLSPIDFNVEEVTQLITQLFIPTNFPDNKVAASLFKKLVDSKTSDPSNLRESCIAQVLKLEKVQWNHIYDAEIDILQNYRGKSAASSNETSSSSSESTSTSASTTTVTDKDRDEDSTSSSVPSSKEDVVTTSVSSSSSESASTSSSASATTVTGKDQVQDNASSSLPSSKGDVVPTSASSSSSSSSSQNTTISNNPYLVHAKDMQTMSTWPGVAAERLQKFTDLLKQKDKNTWSNQNAKVTELVNITEAAKVFINTAATNFKSNKVVHNALEPFEQARQSFFKTAKDIISKYPNAPIKFEFSTASNPASASASAGGAADHLSISPSATSNDGVAALGELGDILNHDA